MTSIHECRTRLTKYFQQLIQHGHFLNEYGRIDPSLELSPHLPNYTCTSQFFFHFHIIDQILYFKVLPSDASDTNCSYLRHPQHFDGFFCSKEQSQIIFDNYFPYDVLHEQALLHPNNEYTFDFWF